MFWDITQRSPQRNHCSHLNLIPFRYNPVTALVPLSGTPPFQACPITDHFLTFHHGESHNGWFKLAHFNSKLNAYQKLTAQKIVALKKDIFANLPTETMGIFHLEQILENSRLLWDFRGQWTVIWRTKYSGVSTLILPYSYLTTCTSPRPLKFSSA